MIFLTILYLCFFSGSWNTLALPTDFRSPQKFPTIHLQSVFIREDAAASKFDSRSIYGILWSCLSTIFTCSWITAHPNIPAPGDSRWTVLRRRVAIMGYVLLAPEFVILWAARQHYAARKFTKKHQANTGWTRAHAFFLIMGGFTLHEGGKAVRVLEAKDLEELSEGGNIEWPTITEEEIADRSKGDYLSKTIVLAQTTWFIIQCIARGAYGLAVTELEVATLAFATLTGVIYYFWWDKPLDVRCSVPVHLLPGQLRKNKEGIEKKDTGSHIIPSPEVSDHAIPEGDGRVVLNPNPTPIQGETSTPDPALTSTGSHIISPPEVFDQEILEGDENVVVNPNPLPLTSIQVDTFAPDPALTRMQRFQAKLFGLGYVFVVFPLERFLRAFQDMMMCKTLRDNPLRVPTFYSPPNEKDDNFIQFIWYCVSIIFGAIHCIAWSYICRPRFRLAHFYRCVVGPICTICQGEEYC